METKTTFEIVYVQVWYDWGGKKTGKVLIEKDSLEDAQAWAEQMFQIPDIISVQPVCELDDGE